MNVNNIDLDVLFKINYYINRQNNKNIKHPLNVGPQNIIITTNKGIESINIRQLLYKNNDIILNFADISFFDQLL